MKLFFFLIWSAKIAEPTISVGEQSINIVNSLLDARSMNESDAEEKLRYVQARQ